MFHSRKDSSPRSQVLESWFRRRSEDREALGHGTEVQQVSTPSLGHRHRDPSSATSSSPLSDLSSLVSNQSRLATSPTASFESRTRNSNSSPITSGKRCSVCGHLDSPCSIAWLDLKGSANVGCQACQLLVTGIDAYFNAGFIGLRRAGNDNLDQRTAEDLLRIHLHLSRGALKVGVGWRDKSGLFDQCEFYTETGTQISPWRGLGAARSVAKGTPDSFDVLRGWISNCMINHPGCNSRGGGYLPLRVIDVGRPGDQRPFLYVSQKQPDFYTALSHCWGTIPLLHTTKSNLSDHRSRIEWTALSETFQNAISTTQALGIRYLWIDSLCILQDDVTDWEEQSAQMASVYSNAHVVLAATDAEDGAQGFLSRHPSRPAKGPFIAQLENGNFYNVYVRNIRRHFSFRLQYPGAQLEHPLFKRAWAFQEELLASRIVHFTKYGTSPIPTPPTKSVFRSELVWECKTAIACECMDLDAFDPKSAKLLYHKSLLPTATNQDKFANWQRIVTSYMSKGISFEKDRIPALAGLATQMQAAGAGQYLAGLWRDHLLLDLLWESFGRRRADPYLAPTWSWASTVGGTTVYYPPVQKDGSYHIENVRAKVVDVQWELWGQELNSTVKTGILTIAAPIIEVELHPRVDDVSYPEYWEIRYKGQRAPVVRDLLDDNRTDRISCLFIGDARINSDSIIHGIILQKSADGSQTYERIGSMIPGAGVFHHGFPSETLHPDQWCKDVKDTIVTII